MTRKHIAYRKGRTLQRAHSSSRAGFAQVFQIVGSVAIGAATIVVGIQANRISRLSAVMEKRSTELAEHANTISKQSLELSQQAIERMREANAVSSQSLLVSEQALNTMKGANEISNQALLKMQNANAIADNSVKLAEAANKIAEKEAELSRSQLELASRAAEPQINLVPESLVGYTVITVSVSNNPVSDFTIDFVCYKTAYRLFGTSASRKVCAYKNHLISVQRDRNAGLGNLAKITISSKLQTEVDLENRKIAEAARAKESRFYIVDDYVLFRLRYKTTSGAPSEAYYSFSDSRIESIEASRIPPTVQSLFDDIIGRMKLPALSETTNEIIKDLESQN